MEFPFPCSWKLVKEKNTGDVACTASLLKQCDIVNTNVSLVFTFRRTSTNRSETKKSLKGRDADLNFAPLCVRCTVYSLKSGHNIEKQLLKIAHHGLKFRAIVMNK